MKCLRRKKRLNAAATTTLDLSSCSNLPMPTCYLVLSARSLPVHVSLLDPAYTIVSVVLLCMYTEFAVRVLRVDVNIPLRVLLAELLSLMGAVDYTLVQLEAT